MVFIQNWFTIRIVVLGFLKPPYRNLVRLGTSYGGWFIPQNFLETEAKKNILSIGVGFDISFDQELSKIDANLVLVDPLLDCISFAQEKLSSYEKCFFENVAVSNFDGTEAFFPPKNANHDAWSSTNIQSTSLKMSQIFPVVSLRTLLLKHESLFSSGLTYLKMDIEGAEVKVIPDLYNLKRKFDFVGIEFDFLSLIPFLDFRQRFNSILLARGFLRRLHAAGYRLVETDNFNFFWDGSYESSS